MIFFKSKYIERLRGDVKYLESQRSQLQKDIWDLRRDLNLLALHFGMQFQDVHKRDLVKVFHEKSK